MVWPSNRLWHSQRDPPHKEGDKSCNVECEAVIKWPSITVRERPRKQRTADRWTTHLPESGDRY
eukprot:SAG31_NODE_1260_length_9073_cov_2.761088_9_plen_64_part_00